MLVLIGSAGMQVGAAISLTLFDDFGPAGTSGLRFLFAAVVMLLIVRPKLRGRTRREWLGIVLYGTAMAAMNMLLYQAIELLPLGVATTLDFLGPCTVAFLASRRLREGMLAIAAFTGVVLMAGFGGNFDPIGIVWGLLAGASFAAYTLLAPRIGQADGGLSSVALALAVAALFTTPFSLPLVTSVTLPQWGLLGISALVGTALAFSVDTMAGRLTSARVLGVFFAFDPVLGTIVGALFLDQHLTPVALLGIILVVSAGAGIVWLAGQRIPSKDLTLELQPSKEPHMTAVNESLEIELKYETPAGVNLPAAEAFEAYGLTLGTAETHQLLARYFDTPRGELAAQRVALRVRKGGADEGWHVKLKDEGGTRESHWPFAESMPAGVVTQLREAYGVDAEQVRPIAELRTERRTLRIENGSGVEVVEVADDRVHATQFNYGSGETASDEAVNNDAPSEGRVDRAWREWEAELLPGAEREWLDLVAKVLTEAGAQPSLSSAKIARATGTLVALAEAKGSTPLVIAQLREMDRNDREAARRLGA